MEAQEATGQNANAAQDAERGTRHRDEREVDLPLVVSFATKDGISVSEFSLSFVACAISVTSSVLGSG